MNNDEIGSRSSELDPADSSAPGLQPNPPAGTGSAAVRGPDSDVAPVQRVAEPLSQLLRAAVAGYGQAHPAERAALEMTTSFATTVAASRAINYVRERRRTMPRLRSRGRLLATVPVSNSMRVHHFLPGVGIGLAAGGTAIFRGAEGWGHLLSVPFGIGLALVADELPQLAGRSNPYWGNELFSFTQAAVATTASAGLSGLFVFRGRSVLAARRSSAR